MMSLALSVEFRVISEAHGRNLIHRIKLAICNKVKVPIEGIFERNRLILSKQSQRSVVVELLFDAWLWSFEISLDLELKTFERLGWVENERIIRGFQSRILGCNLILAFQKETHLITFLHFYRIQLVNKCRYREIYLGLFDKLKGS